MRIQLIMPLLLFAMLFTLFMPEEWHYKCLGNVESYKIDTTYRVNINNDTVPAYETYHIIYRDKFGEVLKYKFANTRFAFMSQGRADMLEKHLYQKVYVYRWYSFSLIYIILFLLDIIISISYVVNADHEFDTCPFYILCVSKDKKRLSWMQKKKPVLKTEMKVK